MLRCTLRVIGASRPIPVSRKEINTMSQVIQKFSFNGDVLDVCLSEGTLWVSVRSICDALGIDPEGQRQRIERSVWSCACIIKVQVSGQGRDVYMIDLRTLTMFLATIDSSRCSEEAQPKVARYQIECSKVLESHFFGKQVSVEPTKQEDLALYNGCVELLKQPKPAWMTHIGDDVWGTFLLGGVESIIGRQLQLAAPAGEYAGYMTLTEIANHLELKSSRQAGKLALEAAVRTKPDTDIEGLCKLVLVSGNGTNGIRKQPTFSPRAVACIKEKYGYNMAYGY